MIAKKKNLLKNLLLFLYLKLLGVDAAKVFCCEVEIDTLGK